MFKRLYNSGMCNFDYKRVTMFKPNSAKSKYYEIGSDDLIQNEAQKGSKEEPTFSLPPVPCNWKRGTTNGLTFIVAINPQLKQGGTYIVEGEEGKNILEELSSFSFTNKALSQITWVCRIYEASTQLPVL